MDDLIQVLNQDEGMTSDNTSFLKRKKNLILLISGIIIIIIIIIIFIISFSGNKEEKKDNKDEKNYSFKAIYNSTSDNQNIDLIKELPKNDSKEVEIIEMEIDGKKVEPSKNYTFLSAGNHIVYFLIDINYCDSLNNMFYGIKNMISISFSKNFNIQNIKTMNYMFR